MTDYQIQGWTRKDDNLTYHIRIVNAANDRVVFGRVLDTNEWTLAISRNLPGSTTQGEAVDMVQGLRRHLVSNMLGRDSMSNSAA